MNESNGQGDFMIREHIYYGNCETGDCGGTCPQCSLSICKVCGLHEGSLTTHCSGKVVDDKDADLIYKGKLDFRSGKWYKDMRNRPMYKDIDEALNNEKMYLKDLLDGRCLDLPSVKECLDVMKVWKSIETKTTQE